MWAQLAGLANKITPGAEQRRDSLARARTRSRQRYAVFWDGVREKESSYPKDTPPKESNMHSENSWALVQFAFHTWQPQRVPLVCLGLIACLGWMPTRCADAQQVIPLWDGGAPGFEQRRHEEEQAESYWVKNVHQPTLTAYLPNPENATGAAVVICPGGGHRLLVFNAEGIEAAKYFQQLGVAAFALKYRLGREENSPYKIATHAKQDGQRAMRLVRDRADEWGIAPDRIGIMGFSAGGEVVSLVANGAHQGNPKSNDTIERASCAPNFQILIYPGGIGIPDEIPEHAPPAFLLVTNDDPGASRNVVDLITKFRQAKIPMEAHIYARGGHAFNMGNRSELRTLKTWPDRLTDWMKDNHILEPADRLE